MGFFGLARLAENVNIDLWAYETPDGKSIKKAFFWMLPYASGQKTWDHKQIKPMHRELFQPLERVARSRYKGADDPAAPNPMTNERSLFTLTHSLF